MKVTINGITVEGTPEEVYNYEQLKIKNIKNVNFNVKLFNLELDDFMKKLEKELNKQNKKDTFWI